MTFFLLVVVLVAMSVFALHKGLRCIRCPVTYTALIVAVFLSGVVTFLVQFIPFLTDAFYWSLAVMVLTAGLITALVDAYLLRYEVADEGEAMHEQAERVQVVESKETWEGASEEPRITGDEAPAATMPVQTEMPLPAAASPVPAGESSATPAARSETDLPEIAALRGEETVDMEPPASQDASAVTRMHSLVESPAESLVEGEETQGAVSSAFDEEPDKGAPDASLEVAASADVPPDACLPTDASPPREEVSAPTAASVAKPAVSAELEEVFAAFETLDHYLDFAFREERGGRTGNAICTYRRAMEVYAEDSYAPFIAIELANVCKELGDFHAAADALAAGLQFPTVQANAAMEREFQKNVRFLKALHRILEEEGVAHVPLRQVPKHWQDKAEEMAKI